MKREYIIVNNKARLQWVTRKKAIKHASKTYHIGDIPKQFSAPRGMKKQTVELAKQAWHLRRTPAPPLSLKYRLTKRLEQISLSLIADRRLSTPAGWPDDLLMEISDREDDMWIFRGKGYHEYSRRFGSWKVQAAYLLGRDDGQRWGVRVPYTCATVYRALDWLTPAPIREAQDKRIPVRRQGDIFFRPVRGLTEHDMQAMTFTRHTARPRKDGGLTICHPEHRPIILSGRYKWRAYQSTQLSHGGRTYGD